MVQKKLYTRRDGRRQRAADALSTPPRARATTTLNRKDFGIVWNKALDGGGIAVGDEVEVTIDVEAIKQPPAAD